MMTLGPFTTLLGGMLVLPAANWTEVIIPAVVFVIWIINQIAAFNKGKPQQAPKPQGNRPAIPNPRQNRGPLEEVEQFLRDARKAMEEQQRGGQQPAAPQPRPQPQKPKQQRPQKQNKKPEKTAARKPSEPRRLSQQQVDDGEWGCEQLGGSVSEHVSHHLGGDKFAERAGRLSQIQQSVDKDIGKPVRTSFDHQIGSLTQQTADSVPPNYGTGENPMASILAMFHDPQSMRNAIILQEILQPPTHRW